MSASLKKEAKETKGRYALPNLDSDRVPLGRPVHLDDRTFSEKTLVEPMARKFFAAPEPSNKCCDLS